MDFEQDFETWQQEFTFIHKSLSEPLMLGDKNIHIPPTDLDFFMPFVKKSKTDKSLPKAAANQLKDH